MGRQVRANCHSPIKRLFPLHQLHEPPTTVSNLADNPYRARVWNFLLSPDGFVWFDRPLVILSCRRAGLAEHTYGHFIGSMWDTKYEQL